jgi:hypothetical protein
VNTGAVTTAAADDSRDSSGTEATPEYTGATNSPLAPEARLIRTGLPAPANVWGVKVPAPLEAGAVSKAEAVAL